MDTGEGERFRGLMSSPFPACKLQKKKSKGEFLGPEACAFSKATPTRTISLQAEGTHELRAALLYKQPKGQRLSEIPHCD